MHISHLGLTVSYIPSAASFYLTALQPLGYRYVGSQDNAIGLGIDSADFFLTQETSGNRLAPTHIAFSTDDLLTVRQCYDAALKAGGVPSGPPGYRNRECTCFNAAVKDLDGNTLEFVFDAEHCEKGSLRGGNAGRGPPSVAPSSVHHYPPPPPPPPLQQQHQQQQPPLPPSVAAERQSNAGRSNASANLSAARRSSEDRGRGGARSSGFSSVERAGSRYKTAVDLASATSKAMSTTSSNKDRASEPPIPGITRSRTEPVRTKSDTGSNNGLMGTIVGAAAGAAIIFAVCSSERENAREESAFNASLGNRSRGGPGSGSSAFSSSTRSHSLARNCGTSSSSVGSASRRFPPRSLKPLPRAIEGPPPPSPPAAFDEEGVWETTRRSKVVHHRPGPSRSRTFDPVADSLPAPPPPLSSNPVSRRGEGDRMSVKRSATLPVPQQQAAGRASSSTSRRTSRTRRDSIDNHNDGAVYNHSGSNSGNSKRHDSVIDFPHPPPSLSRRQSEAGNRRSSSASTSTAKPLPRRNNSVSVHTSAQKVSAAEIPLPPSRIVSSAGAGPYLRPSSGYDLPATTRRDSASAARDLAPPTSSSRRGSSRNRGGDGADDEHHYSDGLGDCETVVPDDSISCVDFSARRSNGGRSAPARQKSTLRRPSYRDGDDDGGAGSAERRASRGGVALPVRSLGRGPEGYRGHGWRSAAMDTY